MKLNTKQTEELAINILKARLARLHVDTGFNVNDKTPISDGFIALYTSGMGKEFKKSDFFGKIEVQIKGTRNQKNKKSKKFPLTTVGLNSIKRNGGLLFFVVYLNDDGLTGDICFRELSPLLIDRYLKNMHGKQRKLFQFLPFPEDDNEANNLLLRSLTQISDQQPLVLWNKDENPKQMDSTSIGIKVFSNESLEETLRTTDVVLYKDVDNMHVPVGVVSPEKIEIFHSKKVSVQFPGQKQAIISKLEVYDDKLILRTGYCWCIKLIFIKDSNVVRLDLKDAPNLDDQLNNVKIVLKLLNSIPFFN